jgi:hypothetical protein
MKKIHNDIFIYTKEAMRLSGLTKHELVLIEEYLRFHHAQDDFLRFCQNHTVEAGFSEACAKAQTSLGYHAENIAQYLVTTSLQ